jgi:cell division protein FtsL
MSASGSRGLLTLATRQLFSRWEETLHSWRDQKAEEFENLYLNEISHNLNSTLRSMEELEQLLDKIHADCD